MSEEIHNADVVVPRSLLTGLFINGALGLGMMIATLYCIGDIDAAIAANPLYPFMAVFDNVVGSKAAAAAMASVVVVMSFSATTGCLASTSRLYWAFARDRGLPGWKFLKKTNPKTSIPLYSVFTCSAIAIILSLVNIGSVAAFNGVISISIAGLFSSYLIAASLLLYRRITGAIQIASPDDILTNTVDAGLTWGRWRVPGIWGVANNIFTCIFLVFSLFFSFWPAVIDVTPQNMNWAVLVFGTVICFSLVYYFAWARKVYTGPIIEQ